MRKTQINAYELYAVWCGICSFADEIREGRVVCCIDNKAALGMLIKGWSRRWDTNELTAKCWSLVAALGADVHWTYVRSRANLADGPSRKKLAVVESLGSVQQSARWQAPHQCRTELRRSQ